MRYFNRQCNSIENNTRITPVAVTRSNTSNQMSTVSKSRRVPWPRIFSSIQRLIPLTKYLLYFRSRMRGRQSIRTCQSSRYPAFTPVVTALRINANPEARKRTRDPHRDLSLRLRVYFKQIKVPAGFSLPVTFFLKVEICSTCIQRFLLIKNVDMRQEI